MKLLNLTKVELAALMSGLAVFALKFPSLLKFDEQRREDHIRHNLETLYGVKQTPCDTQLRDMTDPVEPAGLHPAFRSVLYVAHATGVLEQYRFLDQFFVDSIDGTRVFASSVVSCPDCAIKQTRGGDTSYYHQLVGAVIIHPDCKQVLPLIPEPILRHDGETKNDCEQSAVKRLLIRLRHDNPKWPLLIVEDALFAKGTHLKLLKELNISYIIGV